MASAELRFSSNSANDSWILPSTSPFLHQTTNSETPSTSFVYAEGDPQADSQVVSQNPGNWSVSDVGSWLKNIDGLEEFVPVFEKEEVDGETMLTLPIEFIKDMFPTMKKRMKFINSRKPLLECKENRNPVDTCIGQPSSCDLVPADGENIGSSLLPQFPKALAELLESKADCLRPGLQRAAARDRIVQCLFDHFKDKLKILYPDHLQYVSCLRELIAKYPFLRDCNGSGYDTWLQSLKNKFKKERIMLKKFPTRWASEIEKKSVHGKKRAADFQVAEPTLKRSCPTSNDPPSSTTTHATEDIMLINQEASSKDVDLYVLDRLLRTTVQARASMVANMSMDEALKKFSFFKRWEVHVVECNRITGCNIVTEFNDLATIVCDHVIKTAGSMAKAKPIMALMEKEIATSLRTEEKRVRKLSGLLLLSSALKDPVDGVFVVECLGQTLGDELHPRILVRGNPLREGSAGSATFTIYCDKQQICTAPDMLKALACCFSIHYQMNIKFKPKSFWQFVQVFLKLQISERVCMQVQRLANSIGF